MHYPDPIPALLDAEELLAKGEPCPYCGEPWLPLPGGSELVHGPHCDYVGQVDYLVAMEEAVRRIEEAMG